MEQVEHVEPECAMVTGERVGNLGSALKRGGFKVCHFVDRHFELGRVKKWVVW